MAVYEFLLSLIPITLLAAGTVYFALTVSRGLIRVGDQGIVLRTALRLYWMPYRDIASARLVKRWAEVRGREVDAGYDLVLTPIDPTEKPVTVKRLFGRHDNQLIQAVEQWQRYDEQRLANQHLSDGPTRAMRLAIDNHWSEAETADPVPPDN